MEISKNLINSLVDDLPAPSAILDGIETAALLNWEVNPNFSSEGKLYNGVKIKIQ